MGHLVLNYPDRVRVEKVGGAALIILELRIDPVDISCVLGKGGQVAKVIRRRLRTSAARLSKRITLEIIGI
jgi:predicted RNA-binding protein YlqC (UPF0109 family)